MNNHLEKKNTVEGGEMEMQLPFVLKEGGRNLHIHAVILDGKGNGVSTKDFDHVHKVIGGLVQATHGHTHELDWCRGEGEKARGCVIH